MTAGYFKTVLPKSKQEHLGCRLTFLATSHSRQLVCGNLPFLIFFSYWLLRNGKEMKKKIKLYLT